MTPGVMDWLVQCSDAKQLMPYPLAYEQINSLTDDTSLWVVDTVQTDNEFTTLLEETF